MGSMANEEMITRREALGRLTGAQYKVLCRPRVGGQDRAGKSIATGLPACGGVVAGVVVTTSKAALERSAKGEKVILVRKETSPDDIDGMAASVGILTATGGVTCHAAVVARAMNKICIVGCDAVLDRDLQKFAAVHVSIHNHFDQDRHLNRRDIFKQNRSSALAEWHELMA